MRRISCWLIPFGVCATAFLPPLVSVVSAQSTFARGWVDVNFGIAVPAEDSFAVTAERTISQETATFRTTYRVSRGAEFDFGGGVMLTPVVGVGVSVTGTAHSDTADLFARIPHPLRFNAHGEDTAETDGELERTEGTIHLQGMFIVPMESDRVRLRFFGGPSYFRLKADAVSAIRYEQQFQVFGPGNIVDVTSYDTVEIEETGWGFHAGADVSVFFTRVFGVGGVARFSRGTVTTEDTRVLRDDPVELKTGGFHVGGGLRLRF